MTKVETTKPKKEKTPNKKQQECIENIYGKYLVLAGPGTGKTFTLINRILNMLKMGIDSSKILCLTFSDAACSEMKKRLASSMGVLDVGVDMFTFHGFCSEIINEYREDFNLAKDIKVITPAISNQLLKECILELDVKEYRTSKNDPFKMIKFIKDGIDEISLNRLTKNQYLNNIEVNPDYKPKIKQIESEIEELKSKEKVDNKKIEKKLNEIKEINKKIAKALELYEFFELYKNKMEQNRLIDFSDMIGFVLDKFDESPAFLDKVANKYEFILVDEYQDTNKSQNEIIFKITEALSSKNVFVVGDDDQIVYTFQGARLDTIEKYLTHFPDTKVICLNENMRSTQNILDFARNVALMDENRIEVNEDFRQYNIDKKLISKNEDLKENPPVVCTKYNNIDQEYIEVVNKIEAIINSSSCPVNDDGEKLLSEIAILARSNSQLKIYADILKDKNIPFDVKDGKSIFEIKSAIVFISYLQLLSNPEKYSNNLFKLLLLEPFKINAQDYMKIKEKNCNNKCFIDSMKELLNEELQEKEKIEKFIKTYEYLMDYQTSETLRNTIIETGSKTGIFGYFLNCEINKIENIQGIKKVISEAVDLSDKYSLVDFVEYLEMAKDEEIAILTDKTNFENNAVVLSTYHSSKGREFEYVFMPTMMRNNWEASNSSLKSGIPLSLEDYKTEEDYSKMKYSDNVKVIYVGLTRAKKCLELSYVANGYRGLKNPLPTEFVLKSQHLLKLVDKSDYDIENYTQDTKNILDKRDYDYKKEFKNLIDAYLKDKTFSPTGINAYLKCQRQYLYENILELSSKYQNTDNLKFGSLIHSVLENTTNIAKENGVYPELELVLDDFRQKINDCIFSSSEQKEVFLGRGEKTLKEFYPVFILTPIENVEECEYKLKSKTPEYEFFGIIDRIEKNSKGNYVICDYKTGSKKSKSQIAPLGKYENYYNQIALYKYFFEKENSKKVDSVCFIFPEDPQNPLYLTLTKEDCENVKQKFDAAIESLRNYNFEPSYDKETCAWCPYCDFCGFNVV